MTGEMHKSEVTKEAFPLHFKLAKKYKGDVRPFDQYQGPYVFIEGMGRIWLCYADDTVSAVWYSQKGDIQSKRFLYSRTARGALRAFDDLAIKLLNL